MERERERPLLSIERALGEAQGSHDGELAPPGQGGGRRPGAGQAGPGGAGSRPGQAAAVGSYRIVVLGCTRGAGQTVTALMVGHILAGAPGTGTARRSTLPPAPPRWPPVTRRPSRCGPCFAGLEAEQRPAQDVRLDVIASLPAKQAHQAMARQAMARQATARQATATAPPTPSTPHDSRRLADLLAERYPLTMIDPAPSGLTRVLARADQLVVVAPASPDAATSLANTQQWLGAHGYGELAARAVTVVNGVGQQARATCSGPNPSPGDAAAP